MDLQFFATFEAAQEAKRVGQVISGCYVGSGYDNPRYFLVDEDTPEDVMRRISFRIRNGKPMDDYQEYMLKSAERKHGSVVLVPQ